MIPLLDASADVMTPRGRILSQQTGRKGKEKGRPLPSLALRLGSLRLCVSRLSPFAAAGSFPTLPFHTECSLPSQPNPATFRSLPRQPFTATERRLRQSNPAIYGAFRIFARNSLHKTETIPKLIGFDRQARRPGQLTFANSYAVFSLRKNNNHTNSNHIEMRI